MLVRPPFAAVVYDGLIDPIPVRQVTARWALRLIESYPMHAEALGLKVFRLDRPAYGVATNDSESLVRFALQHFEAAIRVNGGGR